MVLPTMKDEKFTAQAATLWGTIPREAREQILKNVFCAECGGSVEIIEFTGEERNGNLILKGSCAKCGQEVARVVETSQVDSSGN
jgi:DNA-directed RNA polymerase subunit RPC12/RpoP